MKPEILSAEDIKRIQLSSGSRFPSCPVVCSSFIICEQIMLAPFDLQGYFENRSSSHVLCLLLSCESLFNFALKFRIAFANF